MTATAAQSAAGKLPALEGSMTAEGRKTYHVEDGHLPCWCDLGRDHTMAEFFAALDSDSQEA